MLTFWITWAALTILVIMLAVYRKFATRNENACVHLTDSEATAIPEQVEVAKRVDKIDRWGKTLTLVDVAFLTVLLSIVFYNAWQISLETMK